MTFEAADGWQLSGVLRPAPGADPPCATVLVHGSTHERDAFGTTMLEELDAHRVASLRFDIRGRGASRRPVAYHELAPAERAGVVLDVAAALDLAASELAGGAGRLAVVGEQDTAGAVVEAAAAEPRVAALALLSPRLGRRALGLLDGRGLPFCGIVSAEDRAGLRATVDAFLASPEGPSRIEVHGRLGFGTTMFSARAFEQPDEPSLESGLAAWLAARLRDGGPAQSR